ncbi:MAG: hypothetical protein QW507_02595 [Candidatus Nanoarchaeia archaeon]|nr:hypothetical protein [Candidatus Haiyanarchaeum thermophilum]MCW1303349.1 hypothetical protein [Candidatus Haiyanarchaeum thermophilum]MCW1304069.1 hypothetical protein [Candidatus Haiyanarchaeum thermophilum]MCW1306509.1 hypothetical protein [Candidatus Haiyanarchaeum thermophilum]MCW1307539.1 hypothetical protein [Candidatus Haiyanarchaeum thermophilum]
MKKHVISLHVLLLFLIFLSFLLIFPSYDEKNGIYNQILDNYQIIWHDGRSPVNFYTILNLAQNGSFCFTENATLGGISTKSYDFIQLEGCHFLISLDISHFILALFLIPVSSSEIIALKVLYLLHYIAISVILVIFYLYSQMLGLRKRTALIASCVALIAGPFLIYSRYLFSKEIFFSLFLLLALKLLEGGRGRKISDLIASILLCLAILSLGFFLYIYSCILFIPLVFLLWKFKKVKRMKLFLIPILITYTSLILLSLLLPTFRARDVEMGSNPFFYIYPNYIPADEYVIYGYYNLSSQFRLSRRFSYVYGFSSERSGIFLFLSGVFQVLFGPKGFIFNSIFLIFSIFGAIELYGKRKFEIWLALLFIFLFGLFFNWHGGVTPRYVRRFEIPFLLLTFFSFYYIQMERRNWVKFLFLVLIILSTLNVTCVAIRKDWTSERLTDVISYDLCLFPFCPVQTREMKMILTSGAEQSKWIANGTLGCMPTFNLLGIITDPCQCIGESWAEREILLLTNYSKVNVEVCTARSGGDGSIGYFTIDNFTYPLYVASNSCNSTQIQIEVREGIHKIVLKSGIFGTCDEEMTVWKSITFEE